MSILWQSNTLSAFIFLLAGLFIGIGIGFVLGVFRHRLLSFVPQFNQWQQWVRPIRQRFGTQNKRGFWHETAVYANKHHLTPNKALLADVYVPPRLLDLSEIEDLHAPAFWTGLQLLNLWTPFGAQTVYPPVPTHTVDDLMWRCQRAIITAGRGTGKTALMAYLTHQFAHDEDKRSLPIFVHVSELNMSGDGVTVLLPTLAKRHELLDTQALERLLTSRLKTGETILLLDGWAEIGVEQQTAVFTWLQKFLTSYPNTRLIVTADEQGYGQLLTLNAVPIRILPFNVRQAEQLIEKWNDVLDLGGVLSVRNCWQAGYSALDTCLHIWQRAFGNIGLGMNLSLRNLLATNLSVTFAFDETPAETPPLPKGVILFFWSYLAYTLMLRNWLVIDAGRLGQIAEETAVNYRLPREQTIAQLLATLAHSGLFMTMPDGSVRFLCRIWRDYLAASYMAQKGLFEDALKYLNEKRWTGVLGFLVGEQGADALPTQLLAQVNDEDALHEPLFRLAEWVPDSMGDPHWQRQTLILLGKLARETQNPFVLRQRALVAMARTNQQGTLTFLTQMLSRSEPFLRRAALSVLPWLATQDPEPIIALIGKGIQDKEEAVRQTAVRALTLIQHPSIERILVAILIGEDELLSHTAAEAIARHAKDATEILREALADEAVSVRRAAIHGLTFLPDSWVMPLLQSVERNDTEWSVREAALVAMERLQEKTVQKLWEPLRIQDLTWLQTYATRKGEGLPQEADLGRYVAQILQNSRQPEIRTAAASTLRRSLHWCADEAVQEIVQTAVHQDNNPQVREAAYLTLCAIHLAYNQPFHLPVQEIVES